MTATLANPISPPSEITWRGAVVAIFTTAVAASPTTQVPSVRALPGHGLEGDRYFRKAGTFSRSPKDDASKEITLIESEAIDAMRHETGISIQLHESRRNIVTRGVPLNHLVGKEFTVGTVRLRGLRLCEPCGHLEKLTQPGVRAALVHRGGLRAQILSEGTISAGDVVQPA